MEFFRRKFPVSVIEFYRKIWELWVHQEYNDFYIL